MRRRKERGTQSRSARIKFAMKSDLDKARWRARQQVKRDVWNFFRHLSGAIAIIALIWHFFQVMTWGWYDPSLNLDPTWGILWLKITMWISVGSALLWTLLNANPPE